MPETGQQSVTKATLTILEPKTTGNPTELDKITFTFNPKDYSITRKAQWKAETEKKKVSPPEFKGPEPAAITIEMFLDASEEETGDITPTVEKLFKCVKPDAAATAKNKPSAPHVRFDWGSAINFKGYVESVAVKYTHFRSTGCPFRGTATVSIKEFPAEPAKQNPTSGGVPGHRTHRVVAGDTLASIAYSEYGAAGAWRQLADANPSVVDDPMRLMPGTTLLIPPS